MAILLVLLCILTFSMMSACGHKGDAPAQAAAESPRISTPGLMDAQRKAREAQVTCADGARCPEAVGMVLSTQETGVETCTGFLIEQDLAVISSRCVPLDLREEGAQCSARIRLYFPENARSGLAAHEADCAGVILAAGDSTAYIRLNTALPRQVLAIDQQGLVDLERYQVFAFFPTSDKPIGEIRQFSCVAAQRSVILPEFTAALSPVAAMSGCDVAVSQFGAPLLDSRNRAHGVIKGSYSNESRLQQEFEGMLGNNQLNQFAFASNFSCINTPLASDDRTLPAECSLRPGRRAAEGAPPALNVIPQSAMASAQAKLTQLFAGWRHAPTQRIRWVMPEISADATTSVLKPMPTCIANVERWLRDYKPWYLFGGYETEAKFDIVIPQYRVEFKLNSHAQHHSEIAAISGIPATVTLNPKKVHELKSSPVIVRRKLPNGQPGEVYFPVQGSSNLPVCR